MAKSNGNTIRWVGTIVLIAGVFVSIGGTWAVSGKGVKDNEKALTAAFETINTAKKESKDYVDKLEEDGCKPAQEHKVKIAVLEEKLTTMQTEQRAGFKAILDRLPK